MLQCELTDRNRMPKLASFFDNNRFNIISWFVTFLIVAGLIGGVFIWRQSQPDGAGPRASANCRADEKLPEVVNASFGWARCVLSIEREIQIKTNVPADKPRYDLVEHRVTRGDSIFAIAESYKLKPETVLWANYDVLQDDPTA